MKRKGKLTVSLMSLTLWPIILLGTIVIIISSSVIYSGIKDEKKSELEASVELAFQQIDMLYPGDFYLSNDILYKGDECLMYNYEVVDSIKEHTHFDVSLFYGNTRYLSTIKINDKRIIKTKAIDEVEETVLKQGEKAFYDNILVGNQTYFAYYKPLYNSDNKIVGMIFIGEPRDEVINHILDNICLVASSVIVVMFITMFLAYIYSRKIIMAINATKQFLQATAKGNMAYKIDPYLIARNDEIGEMGRFALILRKSIVELVGQDPLTKLYNRRSSNEIINSIMEINISKQRSFCLVMGDIDFFKKVNDTYGHLAGDEVLKEVANILSEHIEHLGFVFRWGGEEFLLIYEDMNIEEAYVKLSLLQEQIRSKEIIFQDKIIKITMTFGICEFDNNKSIEELLEIIDEALYIGKNNGRDCIVKGNNINDCNYNTNKKNV